jgi:outer membrane protein OmpA-like peptidoglycan-associated protein
VVKISCWLDRGFRHTLCVQLPEEQMKRFLVVCALLLVAACAQQQPPPPPPVATNPPPPPPPPAPTTFTVYFDYNTYRLTPAGSEIIKLAADAYKAGNPGSVQVTGYTDPSGPKAYNQRLSLHRANAVAAVLEKDGVPKSAVVVSGEGESNSPPNPGEDRRVDIVLGGPPPATPSGSPPPPPPPAS